MPLEYLSCINAKRHCVNLKLYRNYYDEIISLNTFYS